MNLEVLFTILAVLVLLLIRNEIVYRVALKRIDAIHAANVQSIDRGELDRWKDRWDAFDTTPSHASMLFDLRRWTYRQFYPEDV